MKHPFDSKLRLIFSTCVSVAVFLGLSGCVTTTTDINEGDGIIMQDEPPPSEQVEIYQ